MNVASKRKDLQLSTCTDTREPSNENINTEKEIKQERKKILKERVRREMGEIIRRNRKRERERRIELENFIYNYYC